MVRLTMMEEFNKNKQTNKQTNQHTKSVEAEWITWPLLPWEGPLRRWSCRRRASRWSTGRRCYEAEAFHAFILVSMAHFFLAEANIGALVQLLWIRSRLLAAASKYFSKVVFFFSNVLAVIKSRLELIDRKIWAFVGWRHQYDVD